MKNLFKNIKISNKKFLLIFFASLFMFTFVNNSYSGMVYHGEGKIFYGDQQSAEKGCDSPKEVRERFLASCFICDVVISLTREFISVAKTSYGLISNTAYKLLGIVTILWIPFYIMKQVSSFVAVEPSSIVKDLALQFFKIMVAYVAIFIGIEVLIDLLITPFLIFGLDFGEGILSSHISADDMANIEQLAKESVQFYSFKSSVLPQELIFGMLKFLNYLDFTITNHLVIGNSLMCFSSGAGAIDFYGFKFIDIWIFFSGLVIYIFGVAVLISAGYYFLDICYRIGFVAMFFPIFIALWPFNMTKKYFTKALSVVFTAAAVFAFFAIVVSYSLVIVRISLGDFAPILKAIQTDNATVIKKTFDATGIWFLILLFCMIIALKIIGYCKSYANDFFGDSLFGSGGESDFMHTRMTGMTTKAVALAKKPASFAKDVAKTQGKKGLKSIGSKISNTAASAGKATQKGMQQAGKGSGARIGKAIGGLAGGLAGIMGGRKGMRAGAKAGARKGARIGGKAGEAVGKATGKVAGSAVEAGGKITGGAIQGSSKMIGEVKKDKGK